MTTTSSSSNSWASARTAERAAERRETRALEARLAREAADAATQRRITEQEARRDRAQADRDRAEQRRTERATARAAARATRRAKALTWASSHVVELLIYPIALLSFALAAPAMAAYGHTLYGPPGVLLAGITELGMWAFALAVTTTRHQRPQRSVAGLQAGVVVFATVAAGLNLLHGLHQSWSTGVVMAVVSIAGVLAHQLTLAGAPRTRAERRAGRAWRRWPRRRPATPGASPSATRPPSSPPTAPPPWPTGPAPTESTAAPSAPPAAAARTAGYRLGQRPRCPHSGPRGLRRQLLDRLPGRS